jgi:NAD(P)-dependent dehydrogenase (short-subunit alcohol dehydrogenase family)
MSDQRVVVVTGGGAGIGAAVAGELGRQGAHVVTVDPLVSLDGSEQLPPPEETTAERIVAAGGSAEASGLSVTDADGVRDLFSRLVTERGRLDAVINVAGISRPTSYARGTDEDWRGVLSVHLDGYLSVLHAALPVMAAAGHGRILGVTSGSGWRAADTGAYGCAKRSVASLTWQLGRRPPPGVTVNAMSPIAVTRMVTAALGRAPAPSPAGGGGASATGGLSLGSMPEPEQLGPTGAYLASEAFSWCSGQVVFVGGAEVAVVEPPRLLEVVRTSEVASLARVLETAGASAFAPAEAAQASGGGSNPRFGAVFAEPAGELAASSVQTCALVTARPEVGAAIERALGARGITCSTIAASQVGAGFAGAAQALAGTAERAPLDAVVVALAGPSAAGSAGWEALLSEHDGLVDRIHTDAGWARAVADHAAATGRTLRFVLLTDAGTTGGRSRGQSAAQHARVARKATGDLVAEFAVALEAPGADAAASAGELVAHLLANPDALALAGSELVAGDGWCGLRSHPRPTGSVSFGGPAVPEWLDATLRDVVGAVAEERA